MALSILLVSFVATLLLSAAIGIVAGFSWGQLVLFVIAVGVVVQLAYVVLVALFAAERKHRMSANANAQSDLRSNAVSQENDA